MYDTHPIFAVIVVILVGVLLNYARSAVASLLRHGGVTPRQRILRSLDHARFISGRGGIVQVADVSVREAYKILVQLHAEGLVGSFWTMKNGTRRVLYFKVREWTKGSGLDEREWSKWN